MLPQPGIRVPCFGLSWTIWKHKEARPRPSRRLFETGGCAQRRIQNEKCRMRLLRPDSGRDCYGVENRPALHPHPAARSMIISPAKALKRDVECGNFTQ